jgi:hypothetical protein
MKKNSGDRIRDLEQHWLLTLGPNLEGFWITIGIEFWIWIWMEFENLIQTNCFHSWLEYYFNVFNRWDVTGNRSFLPMLACKPLPRLKPRNLLAANLQFSNYHRLWIYSMVNVHHAIRAVMLLHYLLVVKFCRGFHHRGGEHTWPRRCA